MADSKFNNGMEYKQHENSRLAIHNIGVDMQLNNFKRTIKMAQIKALWILVDFLGGSFTIMGIVANIDNIKSVILAILAIAFLMIRGFFYIKKNQQEVRDKEIDLWNKEEDKRERMKKNGLKK